MIALVRACHPGPTVVVTTIALLLGVSLSLSGWGLALVGGTVLVGQLSIGWSNDWLDAQRDAAAGRVAKPSVTGDVTVAQLRLAALFALAASIPLSLLAGWRAGLLHLLLVGSGWAYNAGVKASPLSPLPYLVGFGALPAYVSVAADESPQWWLSASAGLLGVAAHFANAAPDVDDDLAAGIRGAPQRVGARTSLVLTFVVLAAVSLVLVQHVPQDRQSGLLVAAVFVPVGVGAVLAWRTGATRAVFVAVMLAAVVDVSLLVTLP